MGSNSRRIPKVLVSNATAANTGTSRATAVDNDIILLDRKGVELADTATITNNKDADIIKVLLGKGVASATAPVVEDSMPIQLRNIRKITIQPYVAPVQHSVKVLAATALPTVVIGENYSVKIEFHDNHKVNQHQSEEFYTVKATAATATNVIDALVAKINANPNSRIVASKATNDLVITGKSVATEVLGGYQFAYFHVSLRAGFATSGNLIGSDIMTVTGGVQGKGLGQQVIDMEKESTMSYYRYYAGWPNDDLLKGSVLRATAAGKYNLVVIEHGSERSGDLTQTFIAPVTTVVCFATTDGTSSAKQTAFVEKLTSIAESVGVYVSDVVPI